MKIIYTLLCAFLLINNIQAQNNVGIGTNTPDASSKLDITSTDKGLLIPRVALTATNSASPISSPATSLLVYNTATAGSGGTAVSPGFYFWNGTSWININIGTGSGTTTNFLTNTTNTINSTVNGVSATAPAVNTVSLSQNGSNQLVGTVNGVASSAQTVAVAGDVTGNLGASTVEKINGTSLAGLATGILKNTTGTGVPSIAVAADFPVLNQNTTGTATGFTGSLSGDVSGTQSATSVDKIKGTNVASTTPTNGQVLTYNSGTSNWEPTAPATSGTVTSVGLSLPAIFTVSGSPVTTSGTLTGALATQSANTIFAGPNTGAAAAPAFRSLVAADIPSLAANYIQNQTTQQTSANFNIDGAGTIGTTLNVGTTGTFGGNVTVNGNNIFGASTGDNLTNLSSRGGIRVILDNNSNEASQDFAVQSNNGAANQLFVSEGGNAYVRNSLRVGDGSISPSATMDVVRTGGGNEVLTLGNYGNPLEIRYQRSQGTFASPTIIGTGGVIGLEKFRGYDGAAFQDAAQITAEVDGVSAVNNMPGRLIFLTTPSGSVTPSERMRIDNAGNVKITSLGTGIVKSTSGVLSVASSGAGNDYLAPNTAITGATKTKITYDANGLVTAGATATLASADYVNQGITTNVLHGNAAGNPGWGPVALGTDVSGTLPTANGGMGANITPAAIGAIPYASSTTAYTTLPAVASGSYLRSAGTGTAPVWSTMTLPNAATTGDILYASGSNAIGNLADVAIGSFLASGGAATAPTWSSTLGQSGTTTFGSSQLSLTSSTTSFAQIPGLTKTITVAANTLLYVSTDGGFYTNSTTTNSSSIDVAILVDGSILTNGGYGRFTSTNPGSYTVGNYGTRWNLSTILSLTSGSHTITVQAVYVAGVSCQVSSSNSGSSQGELTVMLLKQ